MASRAKSPADPSISPLAQAILVLEGTDPDACALLFPVDVHLTPEQLSLSRCSNAITPNGIGVG